ncbi:MAG: lytic transglycosylase domain-containing protein [Candidatus Rokubacteria bacterium]|nr:lytic transglycosylase domain-containing protein [Candidatus Rokubacteria bacterium]
MPSTAALLGVRDAFDPEQNVDGGARHLRDLMHRFDNDVTLALAAYNAGAQAVIHHRGVPPYPETRAFVARVLGRVGRVATPAVALAEPSSPPPAAPRVRFARLTGDQVRRETDVVLVNLDAAALRAEPAPLPAPAPAAPEPVERVVVSAPAMTRVESP